MSRLSQSGATLQRPDVGKRFIRTAHWGPRQPHNRGIAMDGDWLPVQKFPAPPARCFLSKGTALPAVMCSKFVIANKLVSRIISNRVTCDR